jgi:hypothetical protein
MMRNNQTTHLRAGVLIRSYQPSETCPAHFARKKRARLSRTGLPLWRCYPLAIHG